MDIKVLHLTKWTIQTGFFQSLDDVTTTEQEHDPGVEEHAFNCTVKYNVVVL